MMDIFDTVVMNHMMDAVGMKVMEDMVMVDNWTWWIYRTNRTLGQAVDIVNMVNMADMVDIMSLQDKGLQVSRQKGKERLLRGEIKRTKECPLHVLAF